MECIEGQEVSDTMNLLLRLLALTLRENREELQRSEMLRDQLRIIARDIYLA